MGGGKPRFRPRATLRAQDLRRGYRGGQELHYHRRSDSVSEGCLWITEGPCRVTGRAVAGAFGVGQPYVTSPLTRPSTRERRRLRCASNTSPTLTELMTA